MSAHIFFLLHKIVMRTLVFIFFLIIVACSEEPYVEQMDKANELIHQGKINNSKEQLQKAVDAYGNVYSYALAALDKKFDALLNLAILHAYDGQYSACIEVMKEAYLIRRNEVSMFYYWGQCYANQAKITLDLNTQKQLIREAVQVYEEGLALDSQDPELNYGIGILYGFVAQEPNKALEYLVAANSINPNDINTLFAIANLMFQVGQVQESKKYYQDILDKTESDSPEYQQAERNLTKLQ